MHDPSEQTQMPVLEGKTQVLGLDFKTAGILCYLPICAVNLIASLVVVNSEPKSNRFLQFHAIQSLILCVVYIAAAIANTIITFVPLIGIVSNIAFLGATIGFIWLSVLGMIAASKGEMKRLPYIGEIAEKKLAERGI